MQMILETHNVYIEMRATIIYVVMQTLGPVKAMYSD